MLTRTTFCLRYMGTITGIGDLDPVRWPNSHWRSVKSVLAWWLWSGGLMYWFDLMRFGQSVGEETVGWLLIFGFVAGSGLASVDAGCREGGVEVGNEESSALGIGMISRTVSWSVTAKNNLVKSSETLSRDEVEGSVQRFKHLSTNQPPLAIHPTVRFLNLVADILELVSTFWYLIIHLPQVVPCQWLQEKLLPIVGWDESTAGERQPRVSLWEIEPLTTFPMYPSLFPLRLKRPWYPGASSFQDGRDEAVNGMSWLRGGTGEQGLHSQNFQPVGMYPWLQQRVDPTLLQHDLNQQYQAMLASGLQNSGSGDSMRQQLMQLQQPVQYLQHSGSNNLLLQQQQQQQVIQQSISPHMLHAQNQMLPENLFKPIQVNNRSQEQEQQHTYQEAHLMQSDQLLQRQPSNLPSPSFSKTDFTASNTKFPTSIAPPSVQNMLGSLCREGSGNLLNFSRTGHSMLSEQPPQLSWVTNFAHQQGHTSSSSVSLSPYPGKDAAVEQDTSSLDAHNQALYSANIDSSGLLLPTTVSSVGSSAIDASISSMPLGASAFQSSLYGYMEDSSELLHSAGQVDPQNPTRTFVKVYKSGSVGRSLDITRFTSYHELREELGQMFGIEGLLENPQRSGWQLVFVDRENDVLLLGDDPWEAFVNNVWYIKILSPEDVLKLGKQEAESLSQIAVERMNSSGTDSRDLLSGLPSLGSLEY
ncbi:unnamed protein product [Ilex paraguariensis]|uniref:Auxin-responsive protein n=1 Tax=Ilex paraguariensis TaxID=185542 RepID=A0ABC8R9N8_9AQUA